MWRTQRPQLKTVIQHSNVMLPYRRYSDKLSQQIVLGVPLSLLAEKQQTPTTSALNLSRNTWQGVSFQLECLKEIPPQLHGTLRTRLHKHFGLLPSLRWSCSLILLKKQKPGKQRPSYQTTFTLLTWTWSNPAVLLNNCVLFCFIGFPFNGFTHFLTLFSKFCCIFPSQYLFAIGLVSLFSFRWSIPPT